MGQTESKQNITNDLNLDPKSSTYFTNSNINVQSNGQDENWANPLYHHQELSLSHSLELTNINLDQIPISILAEKNPQLISLKIENCHLYNLEDMVYFQFIEKLDLSHNDLISLSTPQNEVIFFLRQLNDLNLSFNQIRELPPLIFNLDKLEKLNLSNNCISKIYPDIQYIERLVELDLSHNQLSNLPWHSLEKLSKLEMLNLNANKLTLLAHFPASLTTLKVEHNLIKELDGSLLSKLTGLETLILSHNQIKKIPKEISSLKRLKYLTLNDNKLSLIPPEFIQLTQLETINLSNNQFKDARYNQIHIPTLFAFLQKMINDQHDKFSPHRSSQDMNNDFKSRIAPDKELSYMGDTLYMNNTEMSYYSDSGLESLNINRDISQSIDSEFDQHSDSADPVELYRFKTIYQPFFNSERAIVLTDPMVPKLSSLNHGDVFLLHSKKELIVWVWVGLNARENERCKAIYIAHLISFEYPNHNVEILDKKQMKKWQKSGAFWWHLSIRTPRELASSWKEIQSANQVPDDEALATRIDQTKVFRFRDDQDRVDVEIICAGKPICKDILDSTCCILIDITNNPNIYVWTGLYSSNESRSWVLLKAEEIINRDIGKENTERILSWNVDGAECWHFKELFLDWLNTDWDIVIKKKNFFQKAMVQQHLRELDQFSNQKQRDAELSLDQKLRLKQENIRDNEELLKKEKNEPIVIKEERLYLNEESLCQSQESSLDISSNSPQTESLPIIQKPLEMNKIFNLDHKIEGYLGGKQSPDANDPTCNPLSPPIGFSPSSITTNEGRTWTNGDLDGGVHANIFLTEQETAPKIAVLTHYDNVALKEGETHLDQSNPQQADFAIVQNSSQVLYPNHSNRNSLQSDVFPKELSQIMLGQLLSEKAELELEQQKKMGLENPILPRDLHHVLDNQLDPLIVPLVQYSGQIEDILVEKRELEEELALKLAQNISMEKALSDFVEHKRVSSDEINQLDIKLSHSHVLSLVKPLKVESIQEESYDKHSSLSTQSATPLSSLLPSPHPIQLDQLKESHYTPSELSPKTCAIDTDTTKSESCIDYPIDEILVSHPVSSTFAESSPLLLSSFDLSSEQTLLAQPDFNDKLEGHDLDRLESVVAKSNIQDKLTEEQMNEYGSMEATSSYENRVKDRFISMVPNDNITLIPENQNTKKNVGSRTRKGKADSPQIQRADLSTSSFELSKKVKVASKGKGQKIVEGDVSHADMPVVAGLKLVDSSKSSLTKKQSTNTKDKKPLDLIKTTTHQDPVLIIHQQQEGSGLKDSSLKSAKKDRHVKSRALPSTSTPSKDTKSRDSNIVNHNDKNILKSTTKHSHQSRKLAPKISKSPNAKSISSNEKDKTLKDECKVVSSSQIDQSSESSHIPESLLLEDNHPTHTKIIGLAASHNNKLKSHAEKSKQASTISPLPPSANVMNSNISSDSKPVEVLDSSKVVKHFSVFPPSIKNGEQDHVHKMEEKQPLVKQIPPEFLALSQLFSQPPTPTASIPPYFASTLAYIHQVDKEMNKKTQAVKIAIEELDNVDEKRLRLSAFSGVPSLPIEPIIPIMLISDQETKDLASQISLNNELLSSTIRTRGPLGRRMPTNSRIGEKLDLVEPGNLQSSQRPVASKHVGKSLALMRALGTEASARKAQMDLPSSKKTDVQSKDSQTLQQGGGGCRSDMLNQKGNSRLIHIKGRRKFLIRQVPFLPSSLNSGDVFILDDGKGTLIQWNGRFSNRVEKGNAMALIKDIRDKEYSAVAKIVVVEQEAYCSPLEGGKSHQSLVGSNQYELEKFLSIIDPSSTWSLSDLASDSSKIKNAEEGGDDDKVEEELKSYKLYKMIDSTLPSSSARNSTLTSSKAMLEAVVEPELVAAYPLKKEMLEQNYCYLLDCLHEIYLWSGKNSPIQVRRKALQLAIDLYQARQSTWCAPISREVADGESVLFKEKFSNWGAGPPIQLKLIPVGKNVAKKNASDEQERIPIDEIFNNPVSRHEVMVDAGDSKDIRIWRIVDFGKSPLDSSCYGHFFSGDSFIIIYKYLVGNRENFLTYYWQGSTCSINEKGTSAFLTVEVDKEIQQHFGTANANTQTKDIRIIQNQETKHFLAIFKQHYIIHIGKMDEPSNDGSSTESSNSNPPASIKRRPSKPSNQTIKCKLYEVCGSSEEYTRVIQVDSVRPSFKSNSCFIILLYEHQQSLIWHGQWAKPWIRSYASKAAHCLSNYEHWDARESIMIEEGKEPNWFWTSRTGIEHLDCQYYKEDHPVASIWSRLFHLSEETGVFRVHEVSPPFSHQDLAPKDCFFLDAYTYFYIWFNQARHSEKKKSLEFAFSYLKLAKEHRPDFTISRHDQQEANRNKSQSSKIIDQDDVHIVISSQEPLIFTSKFMSWLPVPLGNHYNQPLESGKIFLSHYDQHYSYEDLKTRNIPQGLDTTSLEDYLSDDEFESVLEMSREAFSQLPQWQAQKIKQAKMLF